MQTLKILVLFILTPLISICQNNYYFSSTQFNPNIPTPEAFFGYPIGSHHSRYDKIIEYLRILENTSGRVKILPMGQTNEFREQVLVVFGKKNHLDNLQNIKNNHKQWAHGSKNTPSDQPVIVWLGYNVHGNEASGGEASILTAYYLAAAQGPQIENYLNEGLFLMEPILNPDGRDRFNHWVNINKGNPVVSDPNDREHNEAWPSGRVNHYWFDLNRDWYPLTQVESQNRAKLYHEWMPNVVTDFHEMGTNSTHFFEPTKLTAENPIIPAENYRVLNDKFATYFEKAMNEIGSLYFTKESFDNFYPGYGNTYPDMHGGLGLLFEQASSRGHAQDSENGLLTYSFAVKNQLTNALATIQAAVENKKLLLDYQNTFFSKVKTEALKSGIKQYVFGSKSDPNRNAYFIDILLKHQIKVYHLTGNIKLGNQEFEKGSSFVVPLDQDQALLIRSIFEKPRQFADSIYYDTSAWNMALAYGMDYVESKSTIALGDQITGEFKTSISPINKSSYAYLIDWRQYNAAVTLNKLIKEKVLVKTSMKEFSIENQNWPAGTLMIPVKQENISSEQLFETLKSLSILHQVNIVSVGSGMSQKGADLGSGSFRTIKAPKPLLLVGTGTSQYEAGEVWHLSDTRLEMPLTKIEIPTLARINLYNYTHLIMVAGSYEAISETTITKLKEWVKAGGIIIGQKTACEWLIKKEFSSEKILSTENNISPNSPFEDVNNTLGAKTTGGAIFEVKLDLSHPLAFGFEKALQAVYKNSNLIFETSKTPGATVAKYSSDAWISGYVHSTNRSKINNGTSLLYSSLGSGKVILMADNPNFRAYWYNTNRFFFNALFMSTAMNESRFGASEH